MKLWVLNNIDEGHPIYNSYEGFVIRAQTEKAARQLAALVASDEGPDAWFNEKKSTCVQLKVGGKEDIILSDFHAG